MLLTFKWLFFSSSSFKNQEEQKMAGFLPKLSGLIWKSNNLAGYGVNIYNKQSQSPHNPTIIKTFPFTVPASTHKIRQLAYDQRCSQTKVCGNSWYWQTASEFVTKERYSAHWITWNCRCWNTCPAKRFVHHTDTQSLCKYYLPLWCI